MDEPPQSSGDRRGLGQPELNRRERKKARTRTAIQRQALRLFREQGYEATTVSQIAEAADVSESTYFRYFATKEAVLLWDEIDDLLLDAFRAQPPGLPPLAALRAAMRAVLAPLTDAQQAELQERFLLVQSVPDLRASMLDQFMDAVTQVADLLAERTGRDPKEFPVRVFSGVVIGLSMAVFLTAAERSGARYADLLDDAFRLLETGLPL